MGIGDQFNFATTLSQGKNVQYALYKGLHEFQIYVMETLSFVI